MEITERFICTFRIITVYQSSCHCFLFQIAEKVFFLLKIRSFLCINRVEGAWLFECIQIFLSTKSPVLHLGKCFWSVKVVAHVKLLGSVCIYIYVRTSGVRVHDGYIEKWSAILLVFRLADNFYTYPIYLTDNELNDILTWMLYKPCH